MNATKETCRQMIRLVEDDWGEHTACISKSNVLEFLRACEKRLPTDAAVQRDRGRFGHKIQPMTIVTPCDQ